MPRTEFEFERESRLGIPMILIVVPFVATFVFTLAALYLQRSVLLPPGEPLGGPLSRTLLICPGILFGAYVVVSCFVVRPRTFPFIADYLRALCRGRHGILTLVAAATALLLSLYGLSARWHADATTVTVVADPFAAPRTYAWPDARFVTLTCGGKVISPYDLEVIFADKTAIDIADANEGALRRLFPAIAQATGKARVGLGPTRTCPAFLRSFISEWESRSLL